MIAGGWQVAFKNNMIFNILGPHTGAPRSEYRHKNRSNEVVVLFFSYTVLYTIFEPEPTQACTIAVTAVEMGEKTSCQPTQDQAV